MRLLTKTKNKGAEDYLLLHIRKRGDRIYLLEQHESVTNNNYGDVIRLTEQDSPVRILSDGAFELVVRDGEASSLYIRGAHGLYALETIGLTCDTSTWELFGQAKLKAGLSLSLMEEDFKIHGDAGGLIRETT